MSERERVRERGEREGHRTRRRERERESLCVCVSDHTRQQGHGSSQLYTMGATLPGLSLDPANDKAGFGSREIPEWTCDLNQLRKEKD